MHKLSRTTSDLSESVFPPNMIKARPSCSSLETKVDVEEITSIERVDESSQADKFTTFEDLMCIKRMHTSNFHRICLNISCDQLNTVDIPWPILKARASKIFSFSKNLYMSLEGFFFLWTPLYVEDSTKVKISIIDDRACGEIPKCVNSVEFDSNNVIVSGMSLGTCAHIDDAKRIKIAVGLASNIVKKGVKMASLDVCFYIVTTNIPDLKPHRTIEPTIVETKTKYLLKDYKRVADKLRNLNAKVINEKEKEEKVKMRKEKMLKELCP